VKSKWKACSEWATRISQGIVRANLSKRSTRMKFVVKSVGKGESPYVTHCIKGKPPMKVDLPQGDLMELLGQYNTRGNLDWIGAKGYI